MQPRITRIVDSLKLEIGVMRHRECVPFVKPTSKINHGGHGEDIEKEKLRALRDPRG